MLIYIPNSVSNFTLLQFTNSILPQILLQKRLSDSNMNFIQLWFFFDFCFQMIDIGGLELWFGRKLIKIKRDWLVEKITNEKLEAKNLRVRSLHVCRYLLITVNKEILFNDRKSVLCRMNCSKFGWTRIWKSPLHHQK